MLNKLQKYTILTGIFQTVLTWPFSWGEDSGGLDPLPLGFNPTTPAQFFPPYLRPLLFSLFFWGSTPAPKSELLSLPLSIWAPPPRPFFVKSPPTPTPPPPAPCPPHIFSSRFSNIQWNLSKKTTSHSGLISEVVSHDRQNKYDLLTTC